MDTIEVPLRRSKREKRLLFSNLNQQEIYHHMINGPHYSMMEFSEVREREKEYVHRIALIFRGSKFSQIAALKEFVEKILRMCVVREPDSTVAQILVE